MVMNQRVVSVIVYPSKLLRTKSHHAISWWWRGFSITCLITELIPEYQRCKVTLSSVHPQPGDAVQHDAVISGFFFLPVECWTLFGEGDGVGFSSKSEAICSFSKILMYNLAFILYSRFENFMMMKCKVFVQWILMDGAVEHDEKWKVKTIL